MTELRPDARDRLARFLYVHLDDCIDPANNALKPSERDAHWLSGKLAEVERDSAYDRADQILGVISEPEEP